jgi:hypothetical protein
VHAYAHRAQLPAVPDTQHSVPRAIGCMPVAELPPAVFVDLLRPSAATCALMGQTDNCAVGTMTTPIGVGMPTVPSALCCYCFTSGCNRNQLDMASLSWHWEYPAPDDSDTCRELHTVQQMANTRPLNAALTRPNYAERIHIAHFIISCAVFYVLTI